MGEESEHERIMSNNCEETSADSNTAFAKSEPTTTVGSSENIVREMEELILDDLGSKSKDGGAFSSHSPPSSSECFSPRIERLTQMKSTSKYATAPLEFEIEASKDHWTELLPGRTVEQGSEQFNREGEEGCGEQGNQLIRSKSNSEIFEDFRTQWPNFFAEIFADFAEWEVGKKLAEGGQAEIFEAVCIWSDGNKCTDHYVLKVFKEEFSLRDLQQQWPKEMLQRKQGIQLIGYRPSHCCQMISGMLLKNSRFAFVMDRYWGDLRKLIDLRKQHNHKKCIAPFTDAEAKKIMIEIALGMQSLHKDNILHRDLKASNVLVQPYGHGKNVNLDPVTKSCVFRCVVADYECSVGVVGTGFWRAPEVLLGLKEKNIIPNLFTQESDVYSFGMTCYEILTGLIPFKDFPRTNYDFVIDGARPTLQECAKPWRDLMVRCWHSNPAKRPSFDKIVKCFTSQGISPS